MPINNLPADRKRQIAVGIWSTTILLATLMLSRRLAGAFSAYPPAFFVVIVSVLLLAAGLFAACCMPQRRTAASLLAIVPACVFALSLAAPSATGLQMSIVTLAVISLTAIRQYPVVVNRIEAMAEPEFKTPIDPGTESVSAGIQLHRHLGEDGLEILEGTAVAEFAVGQKLAVVHIAFSPPAFGLPSVECEPVGDADVRWKLAVVQPYGIRIDVTRRGGLDHAETVPIGFYATTARRQQRAA